VRAAESGPGGQELASSTWQRLEELPDPRSPQGRIYPLACLIAIALCAFTASGNDRLTAVGQWIRRASQQDLARLRAPWDPLAGRYRAPDEKTIRVALDRLNPRALARALFGPRPHGRRRPGEPSPAGVRGYRVRRAARQAKALARGRLTAVAVDGKTSRGARRADGTQVHLLGAAQHGGRLLDHLEVGAKHNKTSHFTELLGSADLDGAVVTFDALHTVRANLDWLVTDKKADFAAPPGVPQVDDLAFDAAGRFLAPPHGMIVPSRITWATPSFRARSSTLRRSGACAVSTAMTSSR
jgi:hypothetical protein